MTGVISSASQYRCHLKCSVLPSLTQLQHSTRHLCRHVRKAAEKLYKDVQEKRSRREAGRHSRRERQERPARVGAGTGGSLDRRAMAIEDRNQLSRKLFTITETMNSHSNVRSCSCKWNWMLRVSASCTTCVFSCLLHSQRERQELPRGRGRHQ